MYDFKNFDFAGSAALAEDCALRECSCACHSTGRQCKVFIIIIIIQIRFRWHKTKKLLGN